MSLPQCLHPILHSQLLIDVLDTRPDSSQLYPQSASNFFVALSIRQECKYLHLPCRKRGGYWAWFIMHRRMRRLEIEQILYITRLGQDVTDEIGNLLGYFHLSVTIFICLKAAKLETPYRPLSTPDRHCNN